MSNVVIFDSRLAVSPQGKVVPKKPGDVTVASDGSKGTDVVIAEATEAGRRLKAPVTLTIMCHGKAQDRTDLRGLVAGSVGGAGLDIGNPGLTENNLSLVRPWNRGKNPALFSQIILLACAVGYRESKASPLTTKFDGSFFCGQLAVLSGATVIASTSLQKYDVAPATLLSIFTNEISEVDFGDWEGVVQSFDPKEGKARLYIP